MSRKKLDRKGTACFWGALFFCLASNPLLSMAQVEGSPQKVYRKGRVWEFTILHTTYTGDTLLYDTCKLVREPGLFNINQKKISFTYWNNPEHRMSTSTITGVIEKRRYAWIHPYYHTPWDDCLNNAPFPMVRFPLYQNITWYAGQTTGHLRGPADEISPKWFSNWTYQQTGDTIPMPTGMLKGEAVHKIQAHGGKLKEGSEVFTVHYYWHPEHGFIGFEYDLQNAHERVSIVLFDMKNAP